MVNYAVDQWLSANGRKIHKTGFKEWLSRYHKKARWSVVAVVGVGMVQAGIALLKPWPTKIMADSAFGTMPAPGPLAPYDGSTLIAITAVLSITLFLVGASFEYFSNFFLLKLVSG